MNYATISFLNLLGYVLYGAARYMGLATLAHVALLAAIASLYFTVRMTLYYLRHKAEAPQGLAFRLGFSYACIVFLCTFYAMENLNPTGSR